LRVSRKRRDQQSRKKCKTSRKNWMLIFHLQAMPSSCQLVKGKAAIQICHFFKPASNPLN
jgi:hypothetical protein